MPKRVLIVDDHQSFRGLARRLVEEVGLDVVGEASSGAQALLEERRLRPDVVLLDIQLPDLDGFAVATSLSSLPAPPTVVLVSTREASDYGPRVRGCGALGFISKAELSAASLAAMLGG
ncbi:MAG: response regulator transcription factor [Candidatus Dormibacteraeota bacterium]|nr:response regulator transcription factor [Candidatus Dormibacteraeota bacterium]